jgi:predicted alpha/beta superfamily hydrolase
LQHTLTGNFRVHPQFQSQFLQDRRDLIVYLPPQYGERRGERYPVLYMHDGQNLFDAATAFAHQEWGVDEAAEELIASGAIEPLIIVGIYNAGEQRLEEYTHVRNRRGQGGRARRHAQFVVEELKPFIDSTYRTLSDPANTGLGGSSLGGLVTLYMGLHYPQTFGKLIAMSPSIWWARRAILREIKKAQGKFDQKIWLDVGTCEGDEPDSCVRNVRDLKDALVLRGWQPGADLRFVEDEGAGHDEKAWGFRIREALTFLFPPKARTSEPKRKLTRRTSIVNYS